MKEEKLYCSFCQSLVPLPEMMDKYYYCPTCQAVYVVLYPEDEILTIRELHEEILDKNFWELPKGTSFLELKREEYGVLTDFPGQPEEEGNEVIIVWAKKAK